MWVRQMILAIIGISSGITVAGGLFSFVVSLGVISDFADRTKTAAHVMLYEDCVMIGGVLGSIVNIYQIPLPFGNVFLAVFGSLSGIFVGCWAMALAEVLNVFPIFIRRAKVLNGIPYLVLGLALGKGIGSLIFFWKGW